MFEAYVARPDRSYTIVHHRSNPVSSHQAKTALSRGWTIERTVRHVNSLVAGCVLVGFATHQDCEVLGWTENPPCQLNDLQRHYNAVRCSLPDMCELGLPQLTSRKRVHSLKDMAKHVLKVNIQGGVHIAIEDAGVMMALFAYDRDDLLKKIRVRT